MIPTEQRAAPLCSASRLPAPYAGNLTLPLLPCRIRRAQALACAARDRRSPEIAHAKSVRATRDITDRGARTRAGESLRSISGGSCRRTRRSAAGRTHRQRSLLPDAVANSKVVGWWRSWARTPGRSHGAAGKLAQRFPASTPAFAVSLCELAGRFLPCDGCRSS
jgi:hypothetical protein